jgi:uncharacterized membrane protein YgdD (TMEM256/DUF423 family)
MCEVLRMTEPAKAFRFPLLAAGILGLTGVALGAMGAHALKAPLAERGMAVAWETAARYHLFHAVAALGAAAWMRPSAAGSRQGMQLRWLRWATVSWCVGVGLFSGSLYWLALGGPRWLGPVTPLGGVALMLGWLAVAIAAFAKDD